MRRALLIATEKPGPRHSPSASSWPRQDQVLTVLSLAQTLSEQGLLATAFTSPDDLSNVQHWLRPRATPAELTFIHYCGFLRWSAEAPPLLCSGEAESLPLFAVLEGLAAGSTRATLTLEVVVQSVGPELGGEQRCLELARLLFEQARATGVNVMLQCHDHEPGVLDRSLTTELEQCIDEHVVGESISPTGSPLSLRRLRGRLEAELEGGRFFCWLAEQGPDLIFIPSIPPAPDLPPHTSATTATPSAADTPRLSDEQLQQVLQVEQLASEALSSVPSHDTDMREEFEELGEEDRNTGRYESTATPRQLDAAAQEVAILAETPNEEVGIANLKETVVSDGTAEEIDAAFTRANVVSEDSGSDDAAGTKSGEGGASRTADGSEAVDRPPTAQPEAIVPLAVHAIRPMGIVAITGSMATSPSAVTGPSAAIPELSEPASAVGDATLGCLPNASNAQDLTASDLGVVAPPLVVVQAPPKPNGSETPPQSATIRGELLRDALLASVAGAEQEALDLCEAALQRYGDQLETYHYVLNILARFGATELLAKAYHGLYQLQQASAGRNEIQDALLRLGAPTQGTAALPFASPPVVATPLPPPQERLPDSRTPPTAEETSFQQSYGAASGANASTQHHSAADATSHEPTSPGIEARFEAEPETSPHSEAFAVNRAGGTAEPPQASTSSTDASTGAAHDPWRAPLDPSSYRLLRQQFHSEGNEDAQWLLASVMSLLGDADPAQERMLQANSRHGLPRPERPLRAEDFELGLDLAAQDRELQRILELTRPALMGCWLLRPKEQERLLADYAREDIATSTTTLARALAWSSRLLDRETPELFLSAEGKTLAPLPVTPEAWLASKSMGRGLELLQLAFIWTRALSRTRLSDGVAAALGSGEEMVNWLSVCHAFAVDGRSSQKSARPIVKTLKGSLQGSARDELRTLFQGDELPNWLERGRQWQQRIQHSANRCGLLACGDLGQAVKALRFLAPPNLQEQLTHLVPFTVSPEHQRLRRGLCIDVSLEPPSQDVQFTSV